MKCLKKEQLLFCNKKERESLITYEKAIIKKGKIQVMTLFYILIKSNYYFVIKCGPAY